MDLPPKRKIIIVEGVTNAGKSTAVDILNRQIPGATQIKFSDYYHKSLQRAAGEVFTEFSEASPEITDQVIRSNKERYQYTLQLIRNSPLDDYLIERLHFTDYVYLSLLANKINPEMFRDTEDQLNQLEALVYFLR